MKHRTWVLVPAAVVAWVTISAMAPRAQASQEDDLHRIALAVETIARQSERCK